MKFKTKFTYLFLVLLIAFSGCSTQGVNSVLSFDGVSITYEVQGSGEPSIIFVHGWAGRRQNWDDQRDYFLDRHQVVLVDLAGNGTSGHDREEWTMQAFAKDVVTVLDQLDLDQIILVGHSMGSAVIMEAAAMIPDRILGIVPVDMFQNVEETLSDEQRVQKVADYMNWILSSDNEYIVQSPMIGWEESLSNTVEWLSNELRPKLTLNVAPIVCINSDEKETDVMIARKYASSFDVRIIEGVGHTVMLDAPDEFNTVLEDVINTFQ
ncbi:MAG: alpha/beta hydrolase [Candidatus Neomarinimicrobiota bacterium]